MVPPDEGINLLVCLNVLPWRNLRAPELIEPSLGENISGQSDTLAELVSENISGRKIFRKYFVIFDDLSCSVER